ncbi:transmembrane protein 151B-like, partial [Stegodyphus dumicola]|uniref:transmembrane protein 151B-like n=1 Tax=Stegodyphus dumicola TaxID=202533 RepID=UPI0015A95A19
FQVSVTVLQGLLLDDQRPQKQGLCRSLRRDAHVKCLVLTLLIAGCLAALAWCQCARVTRLVVNFQSFPITTRRTASPCEDGYVFIPVAFMAMLYLVYLVECWHCTTRLELAYKVDSATVYEHIQQMRETQPVIWWKAVCYHYVRRTRHVTRYRNGDAYTTTQVYYERVNSHGSGASFAYTNCGVKDISKKLLDLEKHPATKIRFSKGFAFANLEAANEFDEQRRRFFHENERLDDYMEMCEGLDLVGVNFQEHMVAFAEPHRLPWYVSHMIFWIFSLALLSWPLRVLIQYNTAYVHYQVNKLFGVNYLTPSSEAQMIGHMSRGTTIDSSEFERQIINNNTIAPSYSESLLLRSSSSFIEQNRLAPNQNQTETNRPPNQLESNRPANQTSSSSRRYSTGIPVSISRSSLQNGRVVYYVSPLEEVNNENSSRRTENDLHQSSTTQDLAPPPSYDDALRHCRPLFLPLRRSVTDRDIHENFINNIYLFQRNTNIYSFQLITNIYSLLIFTHFSETPPIFLL